MNCRGIVILCGEQLAQTTLPHFLYGLHGVVSIFCSRAE